MCFKASSDLQPFVIAAQHASHDDHQILVKSKYPDRNCVKSVCPVTKA